MRKLRIGILLVLFASYVAFLNYTLPSNDVVKIVGTEVVRTEVPDRALFWVNRSPAVDSAGNRDIRFINAVFPNEKSRVYRNEDTGWRWPPYLKFDSGNLQAEAQRFVGGEEWAVVRHYGWRITTMSIYPNALSIRSIASPSDAGMNWMRYVLFAVGTILALMVWRLSVLLREWIVDRFQSMRARLSRK
ncbi:MAG: DUF1523 family protein [Rhodobacteraceae bacterium]|nr:DUF1523 family protein [Paracoccaceae bacterium]